MKGLLLKHLYMTWGYSKALLLILAVFALAGPFAGESMFMVYYPSFMASALVTSLIAYDEREKWNVYAAAMPYTKVQYVGSYYLMGLIMGGGVMLMSAMGQLLQGRDALGLLLSLVPMTLIPTALMLPFMFKFGAEKGRIVYFIAVGGAAAAISFLENTPDFVPALSTTAAAVAVGSGVLYGISWGISTAVYQAREL